MNNLKTEVLENRLIQINNRINKLLKERKCSNDPRSLSDIDRLQELRVIVDREINLRECEIFLK